MVVFDTRDARVTGETRLETAGTLGDEGGEALAGEGVGVQDAEGDGGQRRTVDGEGEGGLRLFRGGGGGGGGGGGVGEEGLCGKGGRIQMGGYGYGHPCR